MRACCGSFTTAQQQQHHQQRLLLHRRSVLSFLCNLKPELRNWNKSWPKIGSHGDWAACAYFRRGFFSFVFHFVDRFRLSFFGLILLWTRCSGKETEKTNDFYQNRKCRLFFNWNFEFRPLCRHNKNRIRTKCKTHSKRCLPCDFRLSIVN